MLGNRRLDRCLGGQSPRSAWCCRRKGWLLKSAIIGIVRYRAKISARRASRDFSRLPDGASHFVPVLRPRSQPWGDPRPNYTNERETPERHQDVLHEPEVHEVRLDGV